MSLAVSSLGQRKDEIIRSRKRKLACLYQLQTAAEPLLSVRPRGPQPNSGLANFLEQNDLELGRYFSESTLPPRPPTATATLHGQLSPAPATRAHKSSLNPRPQPFDSNHVGSSAGSPNDDAQSKLQPVGSPQDEMKTRARARLSSEDIHDVSAQSQDGAKRPRSRLTGVVINQARESSPLRRPRSSPSPSSRPAPARQPTASRPESPPYSPGTDPKKTIPPTGEAASAPQPARDVDVLTPTGDSTSSLEVDKAHQQDEELSEPDAQHGEHFVTATETRPVDATSSPSSTGGPHSTNASRTEAHSPATSLEEGTAQSQEPAVSTRPEDQASAAQHERDLRTQNARKDPSRTASPAVPDHHESNRTPHAAPGATKEPTPATASPRPKEANTGGNVPQSTEPAKLASAGSAENDTSKATEDFADVRMEIDGPETAVVGEGDHRINLERISSPQANRIHKRRRKWKQKGRTASLMLGKPGDNRLLQAVRLIRQDHGPKDSRSPGKKRDYLRNMYLHSALNSAFSSPLPNLLHESRKALSTCDWLASLKEEQDDRILRRVTYLQDSNRWSLRQLKPALEPSSPPTHFDLILRDAKWLQTDFREERKFKISLAKALADWCAEWVAAGPASRSALQVKPRKVHTGSREDKFSHRTAGADVAIAGPSYHSTEGEPAGAGKIIVKQEQLENSSLDMFPDSVEDLPSFAMTAHIPEPILSKIPLYSVDGAPAKSSMIPSYKKLGEVAMEDASSARNRLMKASMHKGSVFAESEVQPTEITPEDTFCALFNPEWKHLRTKLNQSWAFKPPSTTLPPQGFYEHRNASHWTWEDDHQLRTFVKDFPSNWGLISDRMSSRSLFTSYADRRTPWECFERLLTMEGPPADASARQYMRMFHWRLEQARSSFQAHQGALQQQVQQHAQNTGQNVPALPQKRFPSPIRVERKSSRRFLAMLDSARKLARKRETNQHRTQNTQQSDSAPAQRQNSNRTIQTPQYFSRIKYEAECQRMEQLQRMREQDRAARTARAMQQQGGQQTLLTNGIAQQMRNGASNVTGNAGPMQAQMSQQPRAQSQQAALQMGMTNGMAPNAQLGVNVRPQANMQGTQRFGPQMHNQEQMQRMLQQMQQQRAMQQFQNQQQHQQSQAQQPNHPSASGSSNMTNGVPNANMLGAYSSNTMPPSAEGSNSPSFQPAGPNNNPNPSSNMVHQNMMVSNGHNQAQAQGGPQTLSSGHAPTIAVIQHTIQQRNPSWTAEQVQQATNEHLQRLMQRQRQNALNAAVGVHGQALNQLNPMQQPFGVGQQHNQYQQQVQYQQNGMLASNHQQARSSSPTSQQQHQGQYTAAQIRQQMYNQQQRLNKGVPSPSIGSSSNAAVNAMPLVGAAGGYAANPNMPLTPGGSSQMHSMRPPSSGTNGIDGQQSPHQQQRPSSSAGSMGQSPTRPVSSQGIGAQSSRPVSAQGQV